MKKLTRILTVMMILAAVCCMTAPVFADTSKLTFTLGPGQKPTNDNHISGFSNNSKTEPEVTVTIDNPDVVKPYKSFNKSTKTVEVKCTALKAGNATVKIGFEGDTYTYKITVKKYVNPVKSVTIGGVTFNGKVFNKSLEYRIPWKRVKGKKAGMKVKLKKGWTLLAGDPLYVSTKKLLAMNLAYPANRNKVRLNGGKGTYIMFTCYNNKEKYRSSARYCIKFN